MHKPRPLLRALTPMLCVFSPVVFGRQEAEEVVRVKARWSGRYTFRMTVEETAASRTAARQTAFYVR